MTKKDSGFIYGTAILIMIFHHLFCWSEDMTVLMKAAWLCRLCIPLFAFVSGYGMCVISESENSAKGIVRKALGQIWKLLKKYWLVVLILVPLGCLLGAYRFDALTFFKTMLTLSCDYNSSWWYVSFYIFLMVIVYPVLSLIRAFSKRSRLLAALRGSRYHKQITVCLLLSAAILFAFGRNSFIFSRFIAMLDNGRFVFTLVFIEGYVCAAYDIIGRILSVIEKRTALLRALMTALLVLIAAAACAVRVLRAYEPAYTKYDAFITVPVILALLLIAHCIPPLEKGVGFFAKYATYMWLVHCIYNESFFTAFFSSGNPAVRYIVLVVMSLVSAYLLTVLEKLLTEAIKKCRREKA